MSEGYRGTDQEAESGQNSEGDTVALNTQKEDLPGQKQEDPPETDLETMAAAEDPAADAAKVVQETGHKRKLTLKVPELEAESLRLRNAASEKGECANCGKPLTGNQVYYCSGLCKAEFYDKHPTSISWKDIRQKALERDLNKCVSCGKPAEEVDHVKEIWEGGPEFDLDNLQSLCHDCHVAKTNENRKRRGNYVQERALNGLKSQDKKPE